jgi:hypothetical protein
MSRCLIPAARRGGFIHRCRRWRLDCEAETIWHRYKAAGNLGVGHQVNFGEAEDQADMLLTGGWKCYEDDHNHEARVSWKAPRKHPNRSRYLVRIGFFVVLCKKRGSSASWSLNRRMLNGQPSALNQIFKAAEGTIVLLSEG